MRELAKEIAEVKAKIKEVEDGLKSEGKTMVEISESMQSKYYIE